MQGQGLREEWEEFEEVQEAVQEDQVQEVLQEDLLRCRLLGG